jgi:Matrixin
MTYRATFVSLLVMFGALLSSQPAMAFCRTTTCNQNKPSDNCKKDENDCEITAPKIYWKSNCVRFNFQRFGTQDLLPEETKLGVLDGFGKWQTATCADGNRTSLTFTVGEDVWVKKTEYNESGKNVNVVFFRDDDWPYKGIDGTLATTSVSFDKKTGEIWDADIAINSANNTFTIEDKKVEFDLRSVVLHEAGHFIGIAHSNDGTAVMAPTYNPGTVHRDLEKDDVDALCDIYPPDRKAACNDEPRGGFGDPDDPNVPAGCCATAASGTRTTRLTSLAFGFGLLALLRLRRKK